MHRPEAAAAGTAGTVVPDQCVVEPHRQRSFEPLLGPNRGGAAEHRWSARRVGNEDKAPTSRGATPNADAEGMLRSLVVFAVLLGQEQTLNPIRSASAAARVFRRFVLDDAASRCAASSGTSVARSKSSR